MRSLKRRAEFVGNSRLRLSIVGCMETSPWLQRALASMLDGLAPRGCGGCERLGVTQALCSVCLAELATRSTQHENPASLFGRPLVSLGPFEPPLSTAVKRLKYGGRTDLARPLAELFWRHNLELCQAGLGIGAPITLVPVPLHPNRLVERGYNQSALLARALCGVAPYGFAPTLLRRSQQTRAQAKLKRSLRSTNLEAAFEPTRVAHPYQPSSVVLIDDVVTTGSTVAACSRALETAGYSVVGYYTLARTERSVEVPQLTRRNAAKNGSASTKSLNRVASRPSES